MKDYYNCDEYGIRLIYKRGTPKIFKIANEDSKATRTVEDMKEKYI